MSSGNSASGSDSPAEPFVNDGQLSRTSWVRRRNAIVRITNACPRVRMAITPSSAANAAPTTPASGTNTNGETSIRTESSPTV